MNTKTIKINNINLHITKTSKFLTTYISVAFTNKYNKDEYNKKKFLIDLLLESTKKYNNSIKLEIEKQNSYVDYLNCISNVFGNYTMNRIYCNFLNNKYSEKDNDIRCLNLIKEIILNPDINNNEFNKESFNNVYNNNRINILSNDDKADEIALKTCLSETDNNNTIMSWYPDIKDVENIKNKDLVTCYNNMINNDRIDIFVIGMFDEEKYIKFFNDFNIGSNLEVKDLYYKYNNIKDENNIVMKVDKRFKQANLVITYKVGDINDYERYYIVPMFNSIFGKSSSCRLFMNVREKHSLAYRIGSSYINTNSILIVSAGIDHNNYDKAVSLIKNNFKNMNKITDKEFEKAKAAISLPYKVFYEDQYSISNNSYYVKVLNEDDNMEALKKIKKIKKEEVEKILNKIKINTILLLYGE